MRLFIFVGIIAFIFTGGCGDNSTSVHKLGEDCSEASDCAGSVCIEELGTDVADDPLTFVDGYCSSECTVDGETGEDTCGEDAVCLFYEPNYEDDIPPQLNCYATGCTTDWDCRDENYTCQAIGWVTTACLPIDVEDGSASREVDNLPYTHLIEAGMEAQL